MITRPSIFFALSLALLGALALPAITAHAAVSTDSLVGYWKFDEGTGTNAADSSGHGNNGTLTNGPTWTTTKPSLNFTNPYALSFDGTDDYVITTSNMGLSGDFEATISAWVKFNDTNTGYKAIVDFGSTGVREGFALFQGINGAGSITVGFYGAQNCNTSASTITTGQWYHLVGTKVPGAIGVATTKLNINGSQQSISCNTSSVPNMVNGKLYIGSDAASEISNSILVDDVRIYSRALSAAEIAELAAGSHTTTIWTGGTSTNWETASNWSPAAVPDPYANIIIRTGTYQPVMTAHNSGSSLTIETSASLDLKNHNFELTDGGSIKGGGTLKLIGGQTMDGVSNTGTGTVIYYGSGSVTGLAAGSTYYNLTIEDPTESGLVGYWKFDEGTGTSAADSSGNGKTGTLTNGPTWTTTKPSLRFNNPYALSFDGTDDYVDTTITPFSNISMFTLSVWVKRNTTNAFVAIGQYDSNTSRVGVDMYNDGVVYLEVANGGNTYGSFASNDTNWHHVVMVYDGAQAGDSSKLKGYLDGTAQTLTFGSPIPSSVGNIVDKFSIGNFSTRYSSGYTDDVRIYNRALSASEVSNLANGYYADPDNSTATITLGSALDVNNDLQILSGILDVSASNYAVTLAGDWYSGTGSFVKRSGTVTLDGTNQTVSGSTIFHNFSKTVSSADTLKLAYNGRQSFSGALTLRGADGNLLSIRSTLDGTAARILLDGDSGVQTIDYLNVKDSNASGGAELECEDCTNSLNNTNWSFIAGTPNTGLRNFFHFFGF